MDHLALSHGVFEKLALIEVIKNEITDMIIDYNNDGNKPFFDIPRIGDTVAIMTCHSCKKQSKSIIIDGKVNLPYACSCFSDKYIIHKI